jgi:hypothetical protein
MVWRDCAGGEAGQPEYVASDPAGVYSSANRVDASCNLVSGYDWNTRKIRVQAEATENIGEIDAACPDANTHLACTRLRIGNFFDNENLGRARFRNPDLPRGFLRE